MRHIIIGHKGQVGSAFYRIIQQVPNWEVLGIDLHEQENISWTPDFIHICISYHLNFDRTVYNYVHFNKEDKIPIVIIHSSVKPRTTEKLKKQYPLVPFVYSPVQGRHPDLANDMQNYPKFFACRPEIEPYITGIFRKLNFIPHYTGESFTSLEYAKIINTSYFGLLINFAQEVAMTCIEQGLDKEVISLFINQTGAVLDDRKLLPFVTPIGGHCIIKNTGLLTNFHVGIIPAIINAIDTMYRTQINDKFEFEKL